MENIVRTIRVYYPVSDEALATLAHGFEKQVFPVKTLIIRAGQFDRQVHFIEKGMTRSYTLHDGKEVTTWFSMEGDVACGSWDLYRNKAGFEYVETLEETLVYSISIETLNELYKSDIDIAIVSNVIRSKLFQSKDYKEFTNWMRVLQQENFLRLQDIHISRLNLSAYERYEKLMSECPALFHRVTLGHIASFLGITQQSLSRIRAKGYFLT